MKNSSKNNYSGKNNKPYKKNSNSNYYSKNKNSSKNNNRFLKSSAKNMNSSSSCENDKNKSNFSSFKRTKTVAKSSEEFSNKPHVIYRELSNKKNFDDWIWGKHSVFEALNSERAINRIWCTSEIYSSEKFYILL